MKTATAMIEMKAETIIIGAKMVSVNQVFITIRLNLVATIKQNALSDTLFNVQSPWHHCRKSILQYSIKGLMGPFCQSM